MTSSGHAATVQSEPLQFREQLRGPLGWVVAFARSKPIGAVAAFVLLLLVLIAIFASLLAPYSPVENHPRDRLVSPNGTYLLGTDQFGRDVLSRVLYGARISVQVGLLSTLVAVCIASTVG